MNPFFVYLIKSTVSLALFYIVFKLAVSHDKMHTVNRFVLLGILVTSAIIPFAEITVFQENNVIPQVEVFRQIVDMPVLNHSLPVISDETQTVQQTKTASVNPVLLIYLFVILLLVVRLIISVVRVLQIIQKAEKLPFQNFILAVVNDFIHPFSFLKNIVISEKDYTENKEMVITHEYAHIKHYHAIDLIICELFTTLHWFNPFMWLLRRDLRLIHEYQADQAVLNKGIDAKKYQLLVIEKAVGERRFAMANHFTQKPILKRIKMMHRKNLNRWNEFKLILFVPVALLLLQAFAKPELVPNVNNLIPAVYQHDSTQIWVTKWVNAQMEIIKSSQFKSKASAEKIIVDGSKFHGKNTLAILQNMKGELMVENKRLKENELRNIVESFIKGKNSLTGIETDFENKNLHLVGNTKIPVGEILYRCDLQTPASSTESVMKIIAESYIKVKKQVASKSFNEEYFLLSNDKKEVVNQMVPIRISLIEPKITRKDSQNKIKQSNQTSSQTNTEKYDVVVYKDRIEVLNENCDFDELKEKVEKILNDEKNKKSISILAFDEVSSERLKKVKFEINNIPDIFISTTVVKLKETDTKSFSYKILLKENGDIYLNDERYSLSEFEFQIGQLAKKMNNGISINCIFEIEHNSTYLQVETINEILRKANFNQVQQEIIHHSVSELTASADKTPTIVGITFSSPINSQQLDRLISKAKNYLKKPNTIEAIIYTNKETSSSDIEILKKELLKAGFKKVTVEIKS